jgi:alpha-galactosidase
MWGWLLLFVCAAHALDNGLAIRPAMGYNTWNDYECNVTAQDIMDSADAIVRQGLDLVGYKYVNLDDCWAVSRDKNGVIVPDPVRFPDGIKAVADYVHNLDLYFGIYTDRGNLTCQRRPGSLGYEAIDAQTYAAWGVDYLKEDSCYATERHEEAFQQYGKMRDALNATGRPIYFSLCGWEAWYAPQGQSLGNSWRIAGDCTDWPTVLNAIDTNANLAPYAGSGGWNDPDMLIGSANVTKFSLSPVQSRTMFSMWAVMTAPLLIGSNVRNLSAWDLQTYTNTEVIAVNQDRLPVQGIRLQGGNLLTAKRFHRTNIWGRQLKSGSWAVVFLNSNSEDTPLTCDRACFDQMNFQTNTVSVRDLWTHTYNGTTTTDLFTVLVPGEGGSVMVRFDPITPDTVPQKHLNSFAQRK